MKTEFITLDKALDLQSVPVVETLNETQLMLRKALALLGPNGENWYQGELCNYEKNAFCGIGAIQMIEIGRNESGIRPSKTMWFLHNAAKLLYGTYFGDVNDSARRTFADIQELFEVAISLAASPKSIT